MHAFIQKKCGCMTDSFKFQTSISRLTPFVLLFCVFQMSVSYLMLSRNTFLISTWKQYTAIRLQIIPFKTLLIYPMLFCMWPESSFPYICRYNKKKSDWLFIKWNRYSRVLDSFYPRLLCPIFSICSWIFRFLCVCKWHSPEQIVGNQQHAGRRMQSFGLHITIKPICFVAQLSSCFLCHFVIIPAVGSLTE